MSLADNYLNSIEKFFGGYHGTWLPNLTLAPGDVVVIERKNWYSKGVFKKVSNLARLGIPFEVETNKGMIPIDLKSNANIEINPEVEASADIPAIAEGKITVNIKFSKKQGFVFQAPETKEISLVWTPSIKKAIKKAFMEGEWEKDWILVRAVVKTPIAYILISQEDNSSVNLYVDGPIPANLKDSPFKIKSKANFNIIKSKGCILNILGGKNLTPMFKTSNVTFAEKGEQLELKRATVSFTGKAAPISSRLIPEKMLNINQNYNPYAELKSIKLKTSYAKLNPENFTSPQVSLKKVKNKNLRTEKALKNISKMR